LSEEGKNHELPQGEASSAQHFLFSVVGEPDSPSRNLKKGDAPLDCANFILASGDASIIES
jgi:hypothetical protein